MRTSYRPSVAIQVPSVPSAATLTRKPSASKPRRTAAAILVSSSTSNTFMAMRSLAAGPEPALNVTRCGSGPVQVRGRSVVAMDQPSMNHHRPLAAVLATTVLAGMAACASGSSTDAGADGGAITSSSVAVPVIDPGDGGDYRPALQASEVVAVIDNHLHPLPVGGRWVYEGSDEDGAVRVEVEVLDERRSVMGIDAVLVRDRAFLDGELVEDTIDFYTQDRDGNVWYLGEETAEYEGGVVVSQRRLVGGGDQRRAAGHRHARRPGSQVPPTGRSSSPARPRTSVRCSPSTAPPPCRRAPTRESSPPRTGRRSNPTSSRRSSTHLAWDWCGRAGRRRRRAHRARRVQRWFRQLVIH